MTTTTPELNDRIELRFMTKRFDLISWIIRSTSYGFWASHVEAITPENTWLGAHYKGGVQARDAGYDYHLNIVQELFVTIPVTHEMSQKFYEFMRAQIGKKYDLGAIFGFVFRRNWQEDDRWFCSELVAAGLVACGWFEQILATQFDHITPRDLLLIISGRVAVPNVGNSSMMLFMRHPKQD